MVVFIGSNRFLLFKFYVRVFHISGKSRSSQHHIWPIKLSRCDMITESITIQGLHVISLALTPIERWEAARGSFDTASALEAWLTVLAVIALIISVVLLFWVFAKHRHYEHCLNLKIAELIITNDKLREIGELNSERVDVLEKIIDAEQPRKEIPALKPSRN